MSAVLRMNPLTSPMRVSKFLLEDEYRVPQDNTEQ